MLLSRTITAPVNIHKRRLLHKLIMNVNIVNTVVMKYAFIEEVIIIDK